MLSRLTTAMWMQEDDGRRQENGHEQPPPPAAAMPVLLGQETEHHHLLATAGAGGGGFRPPSLLDEDWYFDPSAEADAAMDPRPQLPLFSGSSSSSCSNSSLFPLLNVAPTNPFDVAGFDLGVSGGGDAPPFLGAGHVSNSPLSLLPAGSSSFLGPFGGFGTATQLPDFGALAGFDMFDAGAAATPPAAPFAGRSKPAVLRPLEIFPPVGAQPTLFQKRALRRNAGEEDDDKKRKAAGGASSAADDADEDVVSIDASGLNYDSEDARGEDSGKKDGKDSNANSTVTATAVGGDGKGKKKGMPAKNLMAERRRRKKLNDRLYMLRSVVPKISKMDRASILGDAIEYLKELLQKINDLQNELESSPSASSLPPTPTSFHPLTPTLPTLPSRVKEELCASALPSPTSQQPKVEVRLREGRAVNIHMFCARRPGLLLSAMRALDGLGLDVQQAVISCFNGFVLDVFRAEQCKDGPGLLPEEIKAVLLQSAGFHTVV